MKEWKNTTGYHQRSLAVVPCIALNSYSAIDWLPAFLKPKSLKFMSA
jgi:hypothetical protein